MSNIFRRMKNFASLIILFAFSVTYFYGQSRTSDEESAPESLERFNDLRDYENGANFAAEILRKFPENNKIQAWKIILSARFEQSKETLENAEKLFSANPNDEFVLYALGNADLRDLKIDKALQIGEKLLQKSPDNQKFILFYGYVLMSKKRFDEALKFLDSKANLFADKSNLLTTKAEIFYRQKEKDKSFAAFDQAVSANPNNVNALYVAGFYYNIEKKFDKSFPILKRAVELSPKVFHIRQAFWDALLQTQPQDTSEKREALINREIENYLKEVSETSKSLFNVITQYQKFEMPEKQKEFTNKLSEKFPQTVESERVLISQLRRIDANNELKRAEYIKKLFEYIARPQHFEKKNLGEVYTKLLRNLELDNKFSDAEYLKLAEKSIAVENRDLNEPFLTIIESLANRGLFAEAEKFVELGNREFEKRVVQEKKNGADLWQTENSERAQLLNSSGAVFLRQEKYAEAEKFFLKSIETSKKYNFAYKLLGEIYEETEKFDRAEDAYISQIASVPIDKANFDLLKNLYQKRNGDFENFESYLENVKKIAKTKRREIIVSEKIREPKNLIEFSLPLYTGKLFNSNSLKGKVAIINIWAAWCAPCVREMPELQKLYDKYRKTSDVSVITINADEDLETIKNFMIAGKYNFPVLLSDDYFSEISSDSLPTTFFIDKQGRIVYKQVGYTKFLLEEFDWRIEELRK